MFRPEFLNRIDDIIVFHTLTKDDIEKIVSLMAKDIAKRAKESMNIDLIFDNKAINYIAENGYDQAYGARPLRRALQNEVEDKLAEDYLTGVFTSGDKVTATEANSKIAFEKA